MGNKKQHKPNNILFKGDCMIDTDVFIDIVRCVYDVAILGLELCVTCGM